MTTDRLEAQITQQREALAETTDQLSQRLDVKARAKDAATTDSGRPRPKLIAGAALALAAVAGLVWRRQHH